MLLFEGDLARAREGKRTKDTLSRTRVSRDSAADSPKRTGKQKKRPAADADGSSAPFVPVSPARLIRPIKYTGDGNSDDGRGFSSCRKGAFLTAWARAFVLSILRGCCCARANELLFWTKSPGNARARRGLM